MEASIGRDRGQEPCNRECPDHIGAVGTYASRPLALPVSMRVHKCICECDDLYQALECECDQALQTNIRTYTKVE